MKHLLGEDEHQEKQLQPMETLETFPVLMFSGSLFQNQTLPSSGPGSGSGCGSGPGSGDHLSGPHGADWTIWFWCSSDLLEQPTDFQQDGNLLVCVFIKAENTHTHTPSAAFKAKFIS